MFEAARLGKQEKGLQFCFQISINVLHIDGISVVYITVPRLFSLLAATYFTIIMSTAASVSQHLAGYIQPVDQLSEIVIYVRSFENNAFCVNSNNIKT